MPDNQEANGDTESRGSSVTLVAEIQDADHAYKFLQQLGISREEVATVSIKKVKRKVDWYLIPIFIGCFTLQFLDKVAINHASLMGLNKDLKLKGNDYSNVATALFVAYLIAEIPTSFIMNKGWPGKWMGVNILAWGVATMCTAATHNYATLLVCRIFLGIFEASIAPCLMLLCSQWYTKSEQTVRFNFWGGGVGVGQIVGGLISYGFQHVHHASLAGWRIMFLVLGAITIICGFGVLWLVPDTPMEARFLTNIEKAAILHHISTNQTGVKNSKVKFSQIKELLMDVQVWMLSLITILAALASGCITSYSSILIRQFGYSAETATLLNAMSGFVTIGALLLSGFGLRYTSYRWAWFSGCASVAFMGACLMSFLPESNRGGLLAGIYLVNFIVPLVFITYQWTAANVAGHTKRVVAMTLMSASFGVANLIGPQTFRAKEAPRYQSAKVTLVVSEACAAVGSFLLFLYYVWQNKRRAIKSREAEKEKRLSNIGQWDNLTDKQNLTFRYVY